MNYVLNYQQQLVIINFDASFLFFITKMLYDDFGNPKIYLTPETEEFFKNIKEKNFDTIKEYIFKKGNINVLDEDWYTALMIACWEGYIELIKLLVENWADINREWEHFTALQIASSNWDVELVKYLIKHWANINQQIIRYEDTGTFWWNNALMLACLRWKLEIVDILLEHWANVNMKNASWETALMFACGSGNINIVKNLISHWANIQNKSHGIQTYEDDNYFWHYKPPYNEGNSPLFWAIGSWNIKIIELLIEAWLIIETKNNTYGWETLLTYACKQKNGNLDIIKLLLWNGATVNEKNTFWKTALMNAIEMQNIEIINYLIQNGANINIKDNNTNRDALSRNITKRRQNNCDLEKNSNITSILLESGAILDTNDKNILLAAENWDIEALELLIKNWVDIETKDLKWKNALIIACENWKVEMVKFLIKNGVNINHQNNEGRNALFYIIHEENEKNIEIIQTLIDGGIDVNYKNKKWYTALMWSCLMGNIQATKLLMGLE